MFIFRYIRTLSNLYRNMEVILSFNQQQTNQTNIMGVKNTEAVT